MSHKEQRDFFLQLRNQFPNYFQNCSVLDIGSLDINGNNRYLFQNYSYIGVDIGAGKNVDVICKGHEYTSPTQFDLIISSECFEHDMFYKKTIANCVNLTKPGGMFTFTCASTGRAEHGTISSDIKSSPLTSKINEWNTYYKNLTEDDVKKSLNDWDSYFLDYYFEYSPVKCDLYFWGIKK